jgi:hypothetical protein
LGWWKDNLEMEFTNQHFVTEAYLKAWCDPETPKGAFVWVVSKEHHKIQRKSPRSLFSEADFYTVYDSSGNRILELEHKLKDVEDKFILLRDNKLFHRQPLTSGDRKTIALFVSTMFARTKLQRDEQKDIWQEWLDSVEKMPREALTYVKTTAQYLQVKELQRQPMAYHLFNFVNITAPYLHQMNCAIYEAVSTPGFITSDNPCFWFDPAIFNPRTPVSFFGIGSPTLNIILPISPTQYISLERNGFDGYAKLAPDPKEDRKMVDLGNNLTATNSHAYIVVNKNTFNESWFYEVNKGNVSQ